MLKVKKLTLLLLGGLGLALASCNGGKNTDTSTTENKETTTKPSESTTKANTEYKLEVTQTLDLTSTISGSTFFTTGMEEVTVSRLTDGDTTTFKLKSGGSITARYLAIDTPESTAGYDKWGKAASLWNASILSKATSIVVESNGSEPAKDSNGTRYLVYVWYKLEGDTKYTNLNLQTVEMGYSDYTGTSTSCKYDEYFKKAQTRAKAAKQKVFGNDEDIYYPETIQNVSLKELSSNYSNYYNSETSVPTRVSFDAYIVSRSVNNSFVTAVVEQMDSDGKTYQITLSLGYTGGVADLFDNTAITRGSLFHICGFTTTGKTIHGLTAGSTIFSGDSYTTLISKSKYYYSDISDSVISSIEGNKITATKGNYTYVITLKDTDSAAKYTVGSTISGHAYNKSNVNPVGSATSATTIEFDGYTSQISTK